MGIVVQFILRLLALLPLKVHYALGRFVSWMAEKVFRYRLTDVTVNLARSFPELKYDELKELRHKFYLHFGEMMAEFVWFGGCRNPERLRRQHLVEIADPDEINRLYEISPSVMIMMSHAGNWELIGGIQSYDYSGKPTHIDESIYYVVYLRPSTKMWDKILHANRIAALRDKKNYRGYLESREVMRYVFEHKDEKIMYNFITDQHPYFKTKDPMKVNFMHQECSTMKGAADLAHKLGMSVCFLSMQQERRGLYKLNYITICDDASAMSPEQIMNRYYELLQKDIEAQPWNYLWTHRRWK